MWLTRLAIRRPITVLMGLISLVVLGGISVTRLPLNFLPHAEFPFIGVQLEMVNAAPAQVEREVARPVEEVLATLGGVREVFSNSDEDGCFVGVEFDWGRDIDMLRLEVKEKIDQIRSELPSDIRRVRLYTFNTNDMPIVEGRISAKDRDLSESYELIQRHVIDPLSRIRGVGRVTVNGVEPADIVIYLDLQRIKEHNVDVGALFNDLSASNFDLTVGDVTQQGLRYRLRSRAAVQSVEQIEGIPVDDRGLRIGDIADVVYATPVLTYGRFLNLEPAIAFDVQKSSGANTVEVVARVREQLDQINRDPALAGVEVVMFFDQGEQITNSLRGLLLSGFIGAIFAVGILYFFLRHLGATLIVSMAIPISIVGACIYMFFSGRSLNILSMMGLMLGVGMLIDNAVVVLESIVRRMSLGEGAVEATLNGTREVGRAVVSATLTSIVVFAPIIFGASDELTIWLREVGVTISITLLVSLVVSLTVIPLLTVHVMKGRSFTARNRWVEAWTERYSRVLEWTAVRHPWWTAMAIVPILLALTVGAVKVTGFGPDPDGDRGIRREYMQVSYDFADDVDYRVARAAAQKVQRQLWADREKYGFEYIYTWYMDGYAMHRLYLEGHSVSETQLRDLREQLREDLPQLAGIDFQFGDDDSGGGDGAKGFEVTVHGEDSGELERIANEAKRRLLLVDGLQDIKTDVEEGRQEVRVHVDGDRAQRVGLDPATVAQVMGITFRGVPLPRVQTGPREVDLWVMLSEDDRRTIEDLESLTLSVQDGKEITLGQIASTEVRRGPNRITRLNQRTAVRVRGSYEGDDFDDALEEIGQTMESLAMPMGYGWNFGSRIQQNRQQQNQMGINALLALLCVYMIMASLFESLLHPAIVMICVPFASLGVIWLMIATNTPFNIMAMIGMVILIGLVVNNGIVLVDHVNHYRRQGVARSEALCRAGAERFRPILMTATTTILGLLPLALGDSHVGNAQNYPMARALIGGLLSSTLLTLVLLPTYYELGERIHERLVRFRRASNSFVASLPGRVRGRARRQKSPSPLTLEG
jgi:hydrophobic/amphiphilic exporter-1 (mainly G- bacteria), HAE1 family